MARLSLFVGPGFWRGFLVVRQPPSLPHPPPHNDTTPLPLARSGARLARAIAARRSMKWVVCTEGAIQYFATGGQPKPGEQPRKSLALDALDLRAEPQQVDTHMERSRACARRGDGGARAGRGGAAGALP